MYDVKTYELTEKEYNYLLPAIRDKLFNKREIDNDIFMGMVTICMIC